MAIQQSSLRYLVQNLLKSLALLVIIGLNDKNFKKYRVDWGNHDKV